MNAEQLIEQLRVYGLTDEDHGHIVCLLDCWTGHVMSAVIHPDETDKSERSLTIIIAASAMESATGKLLAGAAPTTVGNAWDSWLEVAERAMPFATLVSVSYISNFYNEIGFNMEAFVQGPGKDMDEERRHQHLASRLEYAVSRHYVNLAASLVMDETDPEKRERILAGFDRSYDMLDKAEAMLQAVDGQ